MMASKSAALIDSLIELLGLYTVVHRQTTRTEEVGSKYCSTDVLMNRGFSFDLFIK